MSALIRLALRNALRNRRRTALTAATVAIGTAFTVIVLSLLGGLFSSMLTGWKASFGPVRVVTTEFAEREMLYPLHANIADVDPVLEQIRAIPGVGSAEPMIRTGVMVALGEELGDDVAMLAGSTPEWYTEHLLDHGEVVSGAWLTDDKDGEQVVLGGRVARDLEAKVGDEILLMGTTQHGSMAPISAAVVGIVTGDSVIDNQAFVSFETARWMIDVPDGALEVLVYPASTVRADEVAVAQAIQADLGDAYEVRAWIHHRLWQGQLPIMDGMYTVLGGIVVFIMALAIFNTMTMSVMERTGEIGVMRAMGQSRVGAVFTFLTEAVVIGILGGFLGAILGTPPSLYLETYGINYGQQIVDDMGAEFAMKANMTGDLTPEVLVFAVFMGVLTAALGAFFPAIRAARIQPHEAMRAKR